MAQRTYGLRIDEMKQVYDQVRTIAHEDWLSQLSVSWENKFMYLAPKEKLLVRPCFGEIRDVIKNNTMCLLNGKAGRGKSTFLLWLAISFMLEPIPTAPALPSTATTTVNAASDVPAADVPEATREAVVAYALCCGQAFILSRSKFTPCTVDDLRNLHFKLDYILADNVEVKEFAYINVLASSGGAHFPDTDKMIKEFSKRIAEARDKGVSIYLPPPNCTEVAAMLGLDATGEKMLFKYDVVGGNVRAHTWTCQSREPFTENDALNGDTVREVLLCYFGVEYFDPENATKFELAQWAYYLLTDRLKGTRSSVDSSLFTEIPTTTEYLDNKEKFVTVFAGILAALLKREQGTFLQAKILELFGSSGWGNLHEYTALATIMQYGRNTWGRKLLSDANAPGEPWMRILLEGTLVVPTVQNFPALVDGIFLPNILLQMTTGLKHRGSDNHLDLIAEALGVRAEDLVMIYIVPNDLVTSFTRPPLTRCLQVVVGVDDVSGALVHAK